MNGTAKKLPVSSLTNETPNLASDSGSKTSLDKSITIKNHNTINHIYTPNNVNANDNTSSKSHSPLTVIPMDTSVHSIKSSISPYNLTKTKNQSASSSSSVSQANQNTNPTSITINNTTNNIRNKIKTEISPYEVDDDVDDGESNQKYSPPFLSDLKLEEYQNIKNEVHHNSIADKTRHHQQPQQLPVGSKIITTSTGKKRPLNTTEANIAPDNYSSSIKSSNNNNNLNNNNSNNKLLDSSLNDQQQQQQNLSKKRFKQLADANYSPTPTSNLIQQKNNENLEMIVNTATAAVTAASATRPKSTVPNMSSSISPQQSNITNTSASSSSSLTTTKPTTLKKMKSKTFKTAVTATENDLKSKQQQQQPSPNPSNASKVKLEADVTRVKEEATAAPITNGSSKVTSDISGLRFKKFKNTKNPSTLDTNSHNNNNSNLEAALFSQSNSNDMALKHDHQTQLNTNSSPLQASTLMTPPPSLSHSNSSAGSSSAGSYNNYSGSRSVSPATTTTTTTAVSSKTTNINTMNKMIDTVVGSLTVVEQQQKQLDVDNINNINISKNELNQFEK